MPVDELPLFLNPAAGRGRAGKRQERILELLRDAGIRTRLHVSNAVGDLERQVRQCVAEGATRIAIVGGDGSVHEAVNGIFRAGNAALAVIPSGTGNDFAKACDIPLDWEVAVQQLGERLREDVLPRTIDVGRCNDRYFANGAGIGFDARVTQLARSIRLPIGDIVYLLAIFRAMLDGVATPDVEITTDDFHWQGPMTLANVSNGPWIGGMFHIAPMARNSDGHFDLMLARPVTRWRILALLPKLMRGSHIGEAEIIHRSVSAMTVSATEPLPSHLDGEVQPPRSDYSVKILPGALTLL